MKERKARSVSQKMRLNEKHRRQNLHRGLKAWQVGERELPPTLRRYLKGADEIYRYYGLEPGIDIFVPLPPDVMDKQAELQQRRRFKYEKYDKAGTILEKQGERRVIGKVGNQVALHRIAVRHNRKVRREELGADGQEN